MSDPFEGNEYLSPGFDPQSLRVAELRRIFFEHNIDFKSTAKKSELIEIFHEQLSPQASSLLLAKTNPAPSENKVETVGEASPVVFPSASPTKTPGKRGRPRKHALPDEEDVKEARVPPASTAKKPVGRPRKVAKVEDGEETGSSVRSSPGKRSPTRRQTVTSTSDEEMPDVQETPVRKTPGRPRKSSVKMRETDAVFSSENPFQSRSPDSATPVKRRQTIVPNSTQKLPPPGAKEGRRKTESSLVPQSLSSGTDSDAVEFRPSRGDNVKTPKSAFRKGERFMPAISQLKASPAFQSAAQRRKENDLANEQLLDTPRSESSGDEATRKTASRKKLVRRHKGGSRLSQLLKWTSILGLTAGTAYGGNWWREEKIHAGYCGIDSDPVVRHPGASGLEDLIHQIRPQCQPCPPHAICSPGYHMVCEDEFQRVPSPLSLGGLLPISPECAPDTEKLRRIQVVANEIVETLRDRTAAVECGYVTAPLDGEVGMSETELKRKLSGKKSSSITEAQFTTLFDHAMEEVKSRDEIEITSSKRITHSYAAGGGGGSEGDYDIHIESHYHSTSLANISVACSIRRSFLTVLARYRLELAGLLTFSLLTYLLRRFFQSRADNRIKVQTLVTRVYDALATTKARCLDNPSRHEPHLGVSQLRDSILADEFSHGTRERLWHEVQAIVERNSNVRATQAEIQGEWLRAWEWVGAVRAMTLEEKRREMGLSPGDEFVRPVV